MKIDKRVKGVKFNTMVQGRKVKMEFISPFTPASENEARALAIKLELAILNVMIEGLKALGEK